VYLAVHIVIVVFVSPTSVDYLTYLSVLICLSILSFSILTPSLFPP